MPDDLDPLISISAAARSIAIDRSVLGKQIKQGLVRSHDGKVRLSEVLSDRASNIDLGRSKRREGAIDKPGAIEASRDVEDDDEAHPGEVVMVDGVPVSYAAARALKETYHAKLKQLEFETKQGKLGPVDEMHADNCRILVAVRERLLAVPGKLGGDFTHPQIERVRDELYEAMEELYADGAAAEAALAARDETGDGDDGDETATAPQPRRMGRTVPLRGAKDERSAR